MSTRLRLTAAVSLAATLVLLTLAASSAGARHAAESITLSQTSGLAEGGTVRVTVSGFAPNAKPVKLVIAGQGELVTIPDKLNFDEYAIAPEVAIGPDGTGSADLVVTSDHGVVQDGSTLDCYVSQCWVVAVQEPFLPQPNYDSEPIYFAAGSLTPPPVGETPVAATATTAAPVAETPTTVAPTTEAPTTTTEPTTTTTEVDASEIAASSTTDEGGGGSGPILAIVAVVVVAVGAGGYFLTKKKKDSLPV